MWSTAKHGLLQRLSTPWPDNDVVNIVCHGHSVPAGYFKTPEVRTLDSYPHLLLAALKQSFPFAVINVIVTARGGETSSSGADRFIDDVITHRPHLALIDYALNDRQIGLAQAEQSWTSMIRAAYAANVPVVLVTPTPDLTPPIAETEKEIETFANLVRKLAAVNDAGLLDCTAAFQEWVARGGCLEGVMAQHNHPNRRGHAIIANELLHCLGVDEHEGLRNSTRARQLDES